MDQNRERKIQASAEELNTIPLWGEEIFPGDMYIACGNRGPILLTCKANNGSFLVPTTQEYCYNICDCVKVIEPEKRENSICCKCDNLFGETVCLCVEGYMGIKLLTKSQAMKVRDGKTERCQYFNPS